MSGWLVHQQEVCRLHQHFGYRESALLATGEHGHPLIYIIAAEEKCSQYASQLLLRFIQGYALQFGEEAVFRVKKLKLILGVVGCGDIVSQLAFAVLEGKHPGKNLEQG